MYFLKDNSPEYDNTYIVGIGASAGGLEAINDLFDNVTDSEYMAFIVVQHLSSDYKSLLVELLAKHTNMPVSEARHMQKVEAGKVYVIPNNKELTIQNGLIKLGKKEFEKGPNTSIDAFLQSLAQDQRNCAIAVLLSGTGTDGTKGIEAIKSFGGYVLVQDPATAKFDGMPKNAIASGYVDQIVTSADVYNQICNYIDGIVPHDAPKSKKHQECVQRILAMVFKRTGYDFTQYKQPTILRRIARRMGLAKIHDIESYEEFVRKDEQEAELLAKEFFIGVTNFFRDKDAFDALYKKTILTLVEQKEAYATFKVWVTACCTGQEAYSIAILIDQALKQLGKTLEIKIFASDVDKSSIEIASRARYQKNQLLGVNNNILEQYFIETEDGYTVDARIRKQIVFAAHDILKDPPFIKNDLVSCRNLLIYLNPSLQENVLATLHFALNPEGFLFLGASENPSLLRNEFIEVDSKWKIYQRSLENKSLVRKVLTGSRVKPALPTMNLPKTIAETIIAKDFQKALVENLGYAGVYINDSYEIKDSIGNFKKYLTLPDKLDNFNIIKMAPPELSGIISPLIRKSIKEGKSQAIKNIKVNYNNQSSFTDVFVYPPSETVNGLYTLVVFAESIAENEKIVTNIDDLNSLQKNQYVHQLEEQLKETRNNLQMAVESLETANEELQSSNEELQSANEELQSSNEELQSLNEELHTLNTEHQARIKELMELNDDMTNYMQTSLIGQVFLDNKLRLHRFNQAATSVINIIETDLGRPIDHITNKIRSESFFENIQKVNKNGIAIEREYDLTDGSVYLIRTLPYIRQDKTRDGITITMVDITATKNLNNIIKSLFDASSNPILVFEAQRDKGRIIDFNCIVVNESAYASFGKNLQDSQLTLSKNFPELATADLFNKYIQVIDSSMPNLFEITLNHDKRKLWYQANLNRMQDGFVLILADISSRREAEEKLRSNYNELLATKEILKDLNYQLEQKVKERTQDLETSEERFRLIASLTNDVIWDWSLSDNTVWLSDSFYELFGYLQPNNEVNKHSFRIEHIHPDDRQSVVNALNDALQKNTKIFQFSYRFRKNNGEYANILDRGTVLFDEQGIPYRMIGAMVDVTKLEQSTANLERTNTELRSLFQQFKFVTDFIPQMVWSADADGNVDFYNERWYEYTGLSFEQSKNNGWIAAVHEADREKALCAWQESNKEGKRYKCEYRLRRYDGEYNWVLAQAFPMRDEKSVVAKWFGTCTNINDQKIAEKILEQKVEERTKELKSLNEQLEVSNSDLMQFASVASHDLKEPLRKIHFFGEMIQSELSDKVNGTVLDYINRIVKASGRATNLINDVLSYSRLSTENLVEPVDLNIIVKDILQDLELVIQEKNAKIELNQLPVIDAVAGQMRQLFQNIIANALKFSKADQQPIISISCKQLPAATSAVHNHTYEIRIKDNGIGFNEQYAKKIFSLFQRLHNKEKYEGTGIGLAIASKIVERHHGTIKAVSKEGVGTEFIINIPEKQQNIS